MSVKWRYMPILKWKQGEQLALRNLTAAQWDELTPILKLQPIDAAPDAASMKAALPFFLDKVSDQILKNIPVECAICIDTEYVSPGFQRQLSLLLTACNYLQRKLTHHVIPVLPAPILESLDSLTASQGVFLNSLEDMIISIRTDQIESSQIAPIVAAITTFGIKKRKIHLLIDQYSIVGNDHNVCFGTVKSYIDSGLKTGCASVTVGGGSFPINLVGFKQGTTDISRVEWNVWSLIQQSGDYSGLRYADYAVTNPAPQPDVDPITLNPSVAIRYAADRYWKVYKAKGFKKGPPDQYRNLCKLLVTEHIYSGENFSYGDGQYSKASVGKVGNGNPSSWRKDATNHHIVLTAGLL